MLINNLYNTKISANKYNLALGETATITIEVTDFNGNPVANTPVDLYYAKSESNTQTSHMHKTGTYTTNANGIVTYTVTESNPIKYIYECNGARIELKWDGWLEINISITYVKLFISFDFVRVQVDGSIAVTTSWKTLGTLSEKYRPYQCVNTQAYYGTTVIVTVRDNGAIMIRDISRSWTPGVTCEVYYSRKNME